MSVKSGDAENPDEGEDTSLDRSERTTEKDEPDVPISSSKKDKSPPSQSPAKDKQKTPSKAAHEKEITGSSLDVLSKAATSSFLLQSNQGNKRKKPADDEEKEGGEEGHDDEAEQSADADLSSISAKRRNMWSALLIKRPRTKDPRHLSSWLNEVLTVSDFETPLDGPDGPERAENNDDMAVEKKSPNAEKAKTSKEMPQKDPQSISKEKKNGDKEKKRRKIESKLSEDGSTSSNGKQKKDDKSSSKKNTEKKGGEKNLDGSDKKSMKKNGVKDPSPKRDEKEDGFVGSFADWRDRKKEKALSKKGGGSLRK